MADRMIDVESREIEHYRTGRDLVPLPLERCPICDGELELRVLKQDALVRSAGYGHTRRVETYACTRCVFSRVVAIGSERPPR